MTSDDAERIQRRFEAKARAELKDADAALGVAFGVASAGDPLAAVVVAKGLPEAADRTARRVLAGPDGEAADKALGALGLDPRSVWAVCTRPADAPLEARARRLELVVEAVDPRLVIALDDEAAEDLAAAFALKALVPGRPVSVRGRTLGAVGSLSASLQDAQAKAKVWERLKALVKASGLPGSGS
ncbi:MAG: hypothetical protein Q7W16_07640 [Coriobacteriia bacterium]|nr:hypothetical protein [Coriobacteriia bacterium]